MSEKAHDMHLGIIIITIIIQSLKEGGEIGWASLV